MRMNCRRIGLLLQVGVEAGLILGSGAFDPASAQRLAEPIGGGLLHPSVSTGDLFSGSPGELLGGSTANSAAGEILLWRSGELPQDAFARQAFNRGPAGSAALISGTAISLPQLAGDEWQIGGTLQRSSGSALPAEFSMGVRWSGGQIFVGDLLAGSTEAVPGESLGARNRGLNRTLEGVRTSFTAGANLVSLAAGNLPLTPRHELILTRGRTGPFYLRNSAPILRSSLELSLDGRRLAASDYQYDETDGRIDLLADAVSPLAVLLASYEQATSLRSATQEVSVTREAGPLGSLRFDALSVSGVEARGLVSGEMVTDGPFVSTGRPMALRLSRGPIQEVNEVSADGVPLRSGLDFLLLGNSSEVYIARPIPPGSLIEVTYRTAAHQDGESESRILSLSGHQQGATSWKWSVAARGSHPALDMNVATSVGKSLLIQARGGFTDAQYRSASSLDTAPRRSGGLVATVWRPLAGWQTLAAVRDEVFTRDAPFQEMAPQPGTSRYAVRGVEAGLRGSALGMAIAGSIARLSLDGAPCEADQLSASIRSHIGPTQLHVHLTANHRSARFGIGQRSGLEAPGSVHAGLSTLGGSSAGFHFGASRTRWSIEAGMDRGKGWFGPRAFNSGDESLLFRTVSSRLSLSAGYTGSRGIDGGDMDGSDRLLALFSEPTLRTFLGQGSAGGEAAVNSPNSPSEKNGNSPDFPADAVPGAPIHRGQILPPMAPTSLLAQSRMAGALSLSPQTTTPMQSSASFIALDRPAESGLLMRLELDRTSEQSAAIPGETSTSITLALSRPASSDAPGVGSFAALISVMRTRLQQTSGAWGSFTLSASRRVAARGRVTATATRIFPIGFSMGGVGGHGAGALTTSVRLMNPGPWRTAFEAAGFVRRQGGEWPFHCEEGVLAVTVPIGAGIGVRSRFRVTDLHSSATGASYFSRGIDLGLVNMF